LILIHVSASLKKPTIFYFKFDQSTVKLKNFDKNQRFYRDNRTFLIWREKIAIIIFAIIKYPVKKRKKERAGG
jgi:hypothetical protein